MEGIIVRMVIPSDNSCLFNAVGYMAEEKFASMIILGNPILGSIPMFAPCNSSKRRHPSLTSLVSSTMSATCRAKRRCECHDLHEEFVPYAKSWSWQKSIIKERKELVRRDEDSSDTLIILQHRPVYTLGTGSSEEYLSFDIKNAPFDIYQTERGGEVTYHGPGQLVMYPIMNLRYHRMDLHWYLRTLEELVIRVLSSTFLIKSSRVEGLTGVWVGDQKLAAIGIRVSKWVTYHGLALNVTTDLTPFNLIVPCGIRDRQVGSIKGLLGESLSWNGYGARSNHETDNYQLIDIACKSLLKEFSEVFQVDLHHRPIPLGLLEDDKSST